MVGDACFWMRNFFHGCIHMPNVSQQEVGKIYQLSMSQVIYQWKVVIEHNFFPSLTSNVLDEVKGNISPWLGKWKLVDPPPFLYQELFLLEEIPL